MWRLNDANQIAQNLQCLYPTSAKDKLDIMHCKRVDSPDNDFKLQPNGQLTYKDGCLTRKSNTEPGDLEIKRKLLRGKLLRGVIRDTYLLQTFMVSFVFESFDSIVF